MKIKTLTATIKALLNEHAYAKNIGFEEMVLFYQKATNSQIKEMEQLIEQDDWDKFKQLIFKVLHLRLQ